METMHLGETAAAYLLGYNGGTKRRLIEFTGAFIKLDSQGTRAEISGTIKQRKLAKMCIEVSVLCCCFLKMICFRLCLYHSK